GGGPVVSVSGRGFRGLLRTIILWRSFVQAKTVVLAIASTGPDGPYRRRRSGPGSESGRRDLEYADPPCNHRRGLHRLTRRTRGGRGRGPRAGDGGGLRRLPGEDGVHDRPGQEGRLQGGGGQGRGRGGLLRDAGEVAGQGRARQGRLQAGTRLDPRWGLRPPRTAFSGAPPCTRRAGGPEGKRGAEHAGTAVQGGAGDRRPPVRRPHGDTALRGGPLPW